jgi:hypothetical protein
MSQVKPGFFEREQIPWGWALAVTPMIERRQMRHPLTDLTRCINPVIRAC